MKVYEITKKNNAPNVFGISLVATPAMESDYVMLSKDRVDNLTIEQKINLSKQNDVKFSEIDKEKRLLLGLVLEPNKLIYRYDQEKQEEYYITVSEETILDLQQDYIKQSNQSYSTLEHDGRELDGVTFTEHWIVEDSKIDKSALHGLSLKKGSWVTVAKIENDTLWNDYIKTGDVMGFSIDAMVQLEEINLNKDKKMSETKTVIEMLKDLPNQIKLALAPKKEDVKEVVELKEDDEKKKEVKYEDMTPEEKKAFDAKKKAEEEKEKVAMSETENKFNINEFKEIMDILGVEFATIVKDALKPIQDVNVGLKKEIETLEVKVVELGEQPATTPIKTVPTSVDLKSMTKRELFDYNLKH
jgi:hypothetical protein